MSEAAGQPILLDRYAWRQLVVERRQRADGQSVPTRWYGLLDDISRATSGVPAAPWRPSDAISRTSRLIAWLPSHEALATALAGGPLAYLCWGVPPYTGLKRRAFEMILSRARHLLVNDEVTRADIEIKTGRTATLVPYFVDTDYFTYSPMTERGNFLFCQGSNDRDWKLIAALAELGHEIVWLVNDERALAQYAGRFPRLTLRTRVSFEDLRHLYQTCAAVIMPVAKDDHAAGQTTGLEAVSCGAPLIMSQCRAAGIFAGVPSVSVLLTNDTAQWSRRIAELSAMGDYAACLTHSSSAIVRQRVSRASLTRALEPIFANKSAVAALSRA